MLNNADRALRVREMEQTDALVTIGGTNAVALPTGFLEARSLTIETGGRSIELEYLSPSALGHQVSGFPCAFTIKGSNIVFDRTPDGVYDLSLSYYFTPTPLTETEQTNVILTKYPDIYFYGCLSRVYTYSTETQEANQHYNEFMRAIRGAVKADERAIRKVPRAKYTGSTP